MKWTKKEDQILCREYKKSVNNRDFTELSRTQKSIWHRAQKLGISKKINTDRSIIESPQKLSILLNNTMISNYWLGFILADGNISKNNELRISLSKKDKSHLNKISKYLNINIRFQNGKKCFDNYISNDYYTISCKDSINADKINEMFNIDLQLTKTKSYARLPYNDLNFVLPLYIGLLDGDGCILKDYKGDCSGVRIQCYYTWLDFYNQISEAISSFIEIRNYIDNQGYCKSVCYKRDYIRKLKKYALDNNLPILDRKWNLIK